MASSAFANTRLLGVGLLLVTFAYLAAVVAVPETDPYPVVRAEAAVAAHWRCSRSSVASADLTAAAGVLYVLLPAEAGVSFPKFLAIYLLALIAGIISQVPGGLGVFEAVVVTTLPVELPSAAVLATLLAYRAVYYILPLFVAGGVLAAAELRRHRERLAPVWRGARAWTSALMPHAAAAVVFLAGAVLLVLRVDSRPAPSASLSRGASCLCP